MSATLTIDRTNLSLTPLVIGPDPSTGYTLDPALTIGSVTWRKQTSTASNVPGRTLGDYTRDVSAAVGSITCHGSDETDLQNLLGDLIDALTQTAGGFAPFTMTYTHGAAVYQWTCTEPADLTFGEGETLNDAEMATFTQPVAFTVTRDPIPLAGPI